MPAKKTTKTTARATPKKAPAKPKSQPKEERWLKLEDGINSGIASPRTLAGLYIDEQSSLSLTAVFCAVSTISSLVAGLPLSLYARLPNGGHREATEHPLYPLLNECPNCELTKESYWQTMVAHALLHGNAYSEIERDEAGRPVALHIIPPEAVKVTRDEEFGVVYCVKVSNGQDVHLLAESVFHIAGLAHDGLCGYSPIRLARESLALNKAAESFGAAFFGNAARPAGVLQSKKHLSQQARENLRKSWESLHSGAMNTGRTVVLEDEVTWASISIPPEDAQFLATRQYQTQEIARLFSISPIFLHEGGPAWTDLQAVNRMLLQLTLLPWLNRIEAEARRKLLSKEERPSFIVEHDVTSLLRADTLTRYQAYAIATGGRPWMLPSECRAAERLDPVPGIDDEPAPEPAAAEPEPQDQPQQEDNPDGAASEQPEPATDGNGQG